MNQTLVLKLPAHLLQHMQSRAMHKGILSLLVVAKHKRVILIYELRKIKPDMETKEYTISSHRLVVKYADSFQDTLDEGVKQGSGYGLLLPKSNREVYTSEQGRKLQPKHSKGYCRKSTISLKKIVGICELATRVLA